MKILIIATHSTYRTKPRGLQANRIINELANHHEIFLITSSNSIPDQKDYFKNNLKEIIIVNSLNVLIKKALSKIWNFFSVFDFIWYLRAKKKVIKIVNKNNIQLVISFSVDVSSVLSACWVKKSNSKIKHISFFSDPLSFNNYIVKKDGHRKILEKLENYLFNYSDQIVFPSLKMKEIYSSIYQQLRQKFNYIPHSFVNYYTSTFKRPTFTSKKKYIRYLGALNIERNPIVLLEFIKKNNIFFLENNFVFEFYGVLSRRLIGELKYRRLFNNFPNVRFKRPVNFHETEELYKTSFALIVIDANVSNSPYFPSKVVECFAYRKPIIGITPFGSETARVLNETGHFAFDEKNIKNFIQVIKNILIDGWSFKKETNEFLLSRIIKKWNKLIKEEIA